MFASLKSKIQEETGNEITLIKPVNRHQRNRFESSDDLTVLEQKENELSALKLNYIDLEKRILSITEENSRLEKANQLLEESVKVAQEQKDFISEERDQISDAQVLEITKLKNLLTFRDQEALDRLSELKHTKQQVDVYKSEVQRLQRMEPELEDQKDELERLRHSTQLEKNNLTTNLAAIEEENRHLKTRIKIYEDSRVALGNESTVDEKVKALLQERQMLEQKLEEAHLHLSDIKSTWSNQNLALETQVSRLSRQVAEETADKRKAFKARDEFYEKTKQFEFELEKVKKEILERDNKIKLLNEEVDDLSSTLRELRQDSEQEISYQVTKIDQVTTENMDLKTRLTETDVRLNEHIDSAERVAHLLRCEVNALQEKVNELTLSLEKEKTEKVSIMLKNAEISQAIEVLKQELRQEKDESNDWQEQIQKLQRDLEAKEKNEKSLRDKLEESNSLIESQDQQLKEVNQLTMDLNEKNKSIKILNQRLKDMKKTLQEELNRSYQDNESSSDNNNSKSEAEKLCSGKVNGEKSVVMDDVNFKYLKHVIFKFLTSRDGEARHLIRAVSTVLHLDRDEEQFLLDTITWKSSWFGSKPGLFLQPS